MYIIKTEKGKLTVVKGKTAAGKSMALLADAKDYIEFKMGVLLFTLEQPSTKLLNKMFSKVKAKKEHADCMHIVDMAFSLETIERVIEDARESIDVVYIDSLEKIVVGEEVTNKEHYVMERLTKLAEKKQLPIVITTQVSQENDIIANFNTDKIVEEIKTLFVNEEEYNKSIKHIVLRNFSGYESYDYFSSNVHVVEDDNSVTHFSSINLSDYFNN